MVSDKSSRVTDISFLIDDGTGRIGCDRWVNDSQDTQEVEELTDGIYERIHGHLRSYQGQEASSCLCNEVMAAFILLEEVNCHFINLNLRWKKPISTLGVTHFKFHVGIFPL